MGKAVTRSCDKDRSGMVSKSEFMKTAADLVESALSILEDM